MADHELPTPDYPELLPTRVTDYMGEYMSNGKVPIQASNPIENKIENYRQPQRPKTQSSNPIGNIVEQFKMLLKQIDQQVQLTEQFGKKVSDALWETYCDEIDDVWTKYTNGENYD